MGTYADVTDIEREWNRPVPHDQLPHVLWMLDKAELVVGAAAPRLADRVEAGLISSERVKHVVAAMVVRVLRNPEGKRSETAGDYSYELGDNADTGMYLTPAERRLLGARGRATSIPLVDPALRWPLREPPLCEDRLTPWQWRHW